MSELLDIQEAAHYVGDVSTRTLYREVKRGKLRMVKGKFTVAELERYLSENETTGPGEPILEHRFVLYRFLDQAGDLLYVGITGQGAARWTHHSKYQPWWPDVATIKVEHLRTLDDALAAELKAIQAERPRYNVRHSPR